MDATKIIIFALVAIVARTKAQGFSPLGLPSACEVHTGVASDLAVLDFSRKTAHEAVQRAWALSFERMRAVYLQMALGSKYQAGVITDYNTAIEQHVTAWMLGIVPLWEATRLTNPDFSIASHDGRPGLTLFSKTIVDAIEGIRNTNHTAGLEAIAAGKKFLMDRHFPLVKVFFDGFLNQTNLSDDDRAVLACYEEKTRTDIGGATAATFDAMTAVVNEIAAGTPNGVDSVLAIIDSYAAQASSHGYIEVTVKYIAVTKIYLAQYFEKVGTVRGLFSLQAIPGLLGDPTFGPYQ